MLQLAIAGEPRFVVERCEIDRAGPSYMIDTVRELQRAEPGAHWFLVLGQDQFANLPTWRAWQDLLPLVTLAVAARPGAAQPTDPHLQAQAYQVLPLPQMPITATDIRDRLNHGESITDLVPASVAGYIDNNALYRADARS
jgi:nicotinate-nucleotide adenylyltransferase